MWLGLIALQALTTREGSGKVAGAFDALNSIVERALDPNVAAIPDFAGATGAGSSSTPAAAPASVPAAWRQDAAGNWPTYNVPVPSAVTPP